MSWYPHFLYYWRLPPQSAASYLYALIFIYDHLWESFPFMRIFSVYENLFLFIIICWGLFFLWESLLIYDHLWESFLFMRVSSYLWSSVKIFLFYENLFVSLLIYNHLWESLLMYDQLFHYLFFITLTHLCILILILSSYHLLSFKIYSHLYAYILISMNWKSSWT